MCMCVHIYVRVQYFELEHREDVKEAVEALKTNDYFSLSRSQKVSLLGAMCEELSCTLGMHNFVEESIGELNQVKNERKELKKTIDDEAKKNGGEAPRKFLQKDAKLEAQENINTNSVRMTILGFDRK